MTLHSHYMVRTPIDRTSWMNYLRAGGVGNPSLERDLLQINRNATTPNQRQQLMMARTTPRLSATGGTHKISPSPNGFARYSLYKPVETRKQKPNETASASNATWMHTGTCCLLCMPGTGRNKYTSPCAACPQKQLGCRTFDGFVASTPTPSHYPTSHRSI